jgi:hypothetical protein
VIPIRRREFLGAAAALGIAACRRAVARTVVEPGPRTSGSLATAAPVAPAGGIRTDGSWNPARTWVFAVGILRWRDTANWHSFPTAGRRDAALLDVLRARGVPADQIVYVPDADATRAGIQRALLATVARVRPDDLFWFYYAGHGTLDAAGTMYMVPYDTGASLAESAFALPALLATLDARLRGPVLLTADCCHSGAMATAAAAPHPVAYAALASSLSSESSTGNWTFTECLISGLDGTMPAPTVGPRLVTLQSLADFTVQRMADEEEQLASFATGRGFPAGLRLGEAAPRPADSRVGTYVDARWNDTWYGARIEAARADGSVRVHYAGYPAAQDEWVAAERIRPRSPRRYAAGTRVDAEWHGRWYPAVVRDARLGIHQVHYEGFSDDWDEWVSSRRLRPRDTSG